MRENNGTFRFPRYTSLENSLKTLGDGIIDGIKAYQEAHPEAINLSPEELFEKAADWCGKNILLTEREE